MCGSASLTMGAKETGRLGFTVVHNATGGNIQRPVEKNPHLEDTIQETMHPNNAENLHAQSHRRLAEKQYAVKIIMTV